MSSTGARTQELDGDFRVERKNARPSTAYPPPAIVADATATPSPAGLGSPNRLLSSLLGVAAPSSATGCSRPVPYTGSPRGAGDAAYQPSAGGNNFYAGAETHTGCGRGPVDAAFNVYLLRWSGAS